ncbi:hypothetical protein [Azospirillum rugosum]|uniref:Uncharacterized protein n=1 Tax=Azospirillum rugosum TaxID=416170 RepID=A0ABS4SN81_9PROT|nr:hypothetical protein [Azospirillum rugosum]MBP2294005.1 hypothetical protein [Azospirillum rugosum]MDQ0526808.1 hypothetical protein [Azospirillum rugosum]
MQTLWSTLRRQWLDPGGEPAAGAEHLCDHLRRDIGLTQTEAGSCAPEYIRERNFSEARSFLTLQAYR